MGIEARREVWERVGVIPALTVVAGLFADLDLNAITDTRSAVERAFITGRVGDLQAPLLRQMSRGRAVFSNVGLVTCIKEIVQFAVENSETELSALDLTRCVLGANQDNDQVDSAMMARTKMVIKTTSIAPVASELHSSAKPTFPPESRSAMMPEPTMAARRKAVPRPSAMSRRARLVGCTGLCGLFRC